MIPAPVKEAIRHAHIDSSRLAYVGVAVCKVTYGRGIASPQIVHVVRDTGLTDGAQLAVVRYVHFKPRLTWVLDEEFADYFEMLP